MHAVDTQSWGELVEAARTVVMTVCGDLLGRDVLHVHVGTQSWHALCRDVQVMRTHSAGKIWGADGVKVLAIFALVIDTNIL